MAEEENTLIQNADGIYFESVDDEQGISMSHMNMPFGSEQQLIQLTFLMSFNEELVLCSCRMHSQ